MEALFVIVFVIGAVVMIGVVLIFSNLEATPRESFVNNTPVNQLNELGYSDFNVSNVLTYSESISNHKHSLVYDDFNQKLYFVLASYFDSKVITFYTHEIREVFFDKSKLAIVIKTRTIENPIVSLPLKSMEEAERLYSAIEIIMEKRG
jgi:hypothetical protein